ncbi:unnamed protein product, partial [Ectocarpus sp. 12 AP-2014]
MLDIPCCSKNAGGSGIYKGHASDGGTEGTLEKSTAQADASSPLTPAAVSTSCKSFGGIHRQSNHPQRTAEDGECFLDGECRSYGGSGRSTRSPTMLGSPRNTITTGSGMDVAGDNDDAQHDVQDRNADLTATPPRSEIGFMGSPATSNTDVAYYQPPVSEGYTGDGDDGASTDSGLSWPSTPGSENDGGSEIFRGSVSDCGNEGTLEKSTAGVEASSPASPASSISYKSIGGIRHQSNRRGGNGKRHLDDEGGSYRGSGFAARSPTMFGSLRSIIAGNGMDITDDEEEEQEDDEPSYLVDLIDPAPTLGRRFAESPVTSNNIPAHARAHSPGPLGNENDGGSGTTSGGFYPFEHASRPSTTSGSSYSRSGGGDQQDYDAAQLQSVRPCARRAPPDAVQNDSPQPCVKEGTVSSYGPPKPGDVTSGGSVGIGACWWGEKAQPNARAHINPVVEVSSTSTSRTKRSWDDASLRGMEVSGSSSTSCGGSSASGTTPADGAPDSGTVAQSPNDGLPPSKRLRVYLDDYDIVSGGGTSEAWEESAAGVGTSAPAEVWNHAGRRSGDGEGFPDREVGRLATTRTPPTIMSLRDIIAG